MFFLLIEWNSSTSNSIELEEVQIHSGITLNMLAMNESPKFRQITKKIPGTNLVSKKGKIGWHCEAQHHIYLFCRNAEKRYPYVTKAAAQQQHSSSSAAAQPKQQRRRWWRWRRRRRCRRRQHGKPFLHSCRSSTVVHKKNLISTTSGETCNTTYQGITQIRKIKTTRCILAPYTTYVHIL